MASNSDTPTREQALDLLHTHVQAENLRKHALAVEAVLRRLARRYGGDEDEWGIVGLIHDLDWEEAPGSHCVRVREILETEGWPEWIIRAVQSHGYGICTDVEPRTDLEKALFAVDELTGLITAVALVRPSRSVMDMKAKSVKKKWRTKGFAAGADRELIERGADRLGMPLDELIQETILGMRDVAAEISLDGTPI
jgi:predicted hydrolase (HD superfamily)